MFRTLLIFLFCFSLFAEWNDNLIAVGDVSFTDAKWDNGYNITLSRHRVSDLTKQGKAVVLYFFEACFS